MRYKGVKGNWKAIEINSSDLKQICIVSDANKSVLAHVYLPEYKITDKLKATANLISNSYYLLQALHELLQIKEWKDKNGKDKHYLKAQPLAWSNAKKILEKIDL